MNTEQQKRVLVVDDDPVIRRLLVTILERHSLTIDEASDGMAALARSKSTSTA